MQTQDDILYGVLKLRQPEAGARVNADTVLLAAFPNFSGTKRGNFVEFGSASGAVSLLLGKRFENLRVTGFEIQDDAVEMSKLNAAENGLEERIDFQKFDIRDYRSIPAQSFDGVVVNPPYKSLESGRLSMKDSEAIARQETACKLEDIINAARWLLRSRGKMYCVFTAERMAELMWLSVKNAIQPKRLQMVHPKHGGAASVFLLESIKDGGTGLTAEPPLFIYNENGEYTEEFLKAYTLEGLGSCR